MWPSLKRGLFFRTLDDEKLSSWSQSWLRKLIKRFKLSILTSSFSLLGVPSRSVCIELELESSRLYLLIGIWVGVATFSSAGVSSLNGAFWLVSPSLSMVPSEFKGSIISDNLVMSILLPKLPVNTLCIKSAPFEWHRACCSDDVPVSICPLPFSPMTEVHRSNISFSFSYLVSNLAIFV